MLGQHQTHMRAKGRSATPTYTPYNHFLSSAESSSHCSMPFTCTKEHTTLRQGGAPWPAGCCSGSSSTRWWARVAARPPGWWPPTARAARASRPSRRPPRSSATQQAATHVTLHVAAAHGATRNYPTTQVNSQVLWTGDNCSHTVTPVDLQASRSGRTRTLDMSIPHHKTEPPKISCFVSEIAITACLFWGSLNHLDAKRKFTLVHILPTTFGGPEFVLHSSMTSWLAVSETHSGLDWQKVALHWLCDICSVFPLRGFVGVANGNLYRIHLSAVRPIYTGGERPLLLRVNFLEVLQWRWKFHIPRTVKTAILVHVWVPTCLQPTCLPRRDRQSQWSCRSRFHWTWTTIPDRQLPAIQRNA